MKIRDLPEHVTASKSDWLAGTTWIGFTPTDRSLSARNRCQSTIQRQFGSGYVIEYITEKFGEPNAGFENDPQYLAEREAHKDLAGRFIAVHKLRATARPLTQILGFEEFERLQDMWAQDSGALSRYFLRQQLPGRLRSSGVGHQLRFKRELRTRCCTALATNQVIRDEAHRIAAAEHRRRDANKNIVP
jgi:hypothetical protein